MFLGRVMTPVPSLAQRGLDESWGRAGCPACLGPGRSGFLRWSERQVRVCERSPWAGLGLSASPRHANASSQSPVTVRPKITKLRGRVRSRTQCD